MAATGHTAPSPPATPVLGHLGRFNHRRQDLLSACLELPGNVLELSVSGRTLIVREPEDVRHVLVSAGERYEKSVRATSGRVVTAQGPNTFTARRAEHRPRRRRVQPAFRHDRLAMLPPSFDAAADRALDGWSGREGVDVNEEAHRLARRNVAREIFGVESEDDIETVLRGLAVRRESSNQALEGPIAIPGRLPLALRPARRAALRSLDDLIDRLILRARGNGGSGILAHLADAHPGDDTSLRAELLGVAVPASETTGRTIAWGWMELARNPEIAERLRAGPPGYARAVTNETLRLHPPTPLIARVAVEADELPSGVHVARGTKVLVSPYLTQRDPSLWPDPERFAPERFLDGEPGGRLRYAFYPFGGGPRVCVGQSMAVLEIERTLARTVARYRLTPGAPGTRPRRTSAAPRRGAQIRVEVHA